MNSNRILLERLCRCCMSAACLTGRENLRESVANRDLSAFNWDVGQNRTEQQNKAFPLLHPLLIRCHYKAHEEMSVSMRGCACVYM